MPCSFVMNMSSSTSAVGNSTADVKTFRRFNWCWNLETLSRLEEYLLDDPRRENEGEFRIARLQMLSGSCDTSDMLRYTIWRIRWIEREVNCLEFVCLL